MTYAEFVERRNQGSIAAGIDKSIAFKLVHNLPKRYQVPIIFWSWVWIATVPAFILVSIIFKWWVGLLLLVLVTPTISQGTKNSAVRFVLDHAEEDKDFFDMLVEQNLLVFKVIPDHQPTGA